MSRSESASITGIDRGSVLSDTPFGVELIQAVTLMALVAAG